MPCSPRRRRATRKYDPRCHLEGLPRDRPRGTLGAPRAGRARSGGVHERDAPRPIVLRHIFLGEPRRMPSKRTSENYPSTRFDEYAVFCSSYYRARSARRNSREVAVSKAASPQSNNASTARVMREGTDTANGMSAKQSIVTTNLGTLTLLTALCSDIGPCHLPGAWMLLRKAHAEDNGPPQLLHPILHPKE